MENDRYKYRGRSIEDGGWVYGSVLKFDTDFYIHEADYGDLHDIDFGYGFTKVHSETVGQCTGLKDKNSKLIFEGDIVSGLAYHKRALIAWKDGGFGFMQGADTPLRKELSNGADWYDFVSFSGHNYLNELLGSIEIIGNVHEEQSNGHD